MNAQISRGLFRPSFVWLLLLVLGVAVMPQANGETLRQVLNFNRVWQFQLGDPTNAESAGLDTSSWQNINLPHSFSMPYFLSPKFYSGYGWYRKTLTVPPEWSLSKLVDFATKPGWVAGIKIYVAC